MRAAFPFALLAGCAPAPGVLSGTRDGSDFEVEILEAKIGLIGRPRTDTNVLDFVTIARASTGPLPCDALWFDSWPQTEDPRPEVTDPYGAPDTFELTVIAGWNSGQRWDGSHGGSASGYGGPDLPEGIVDNVSSPFVDGDGAYASAVGLGWFQPDCTGDTRVADRGVLQHGVVHAFEPAYTPAVNAIFAYDELPRITPTGDRVPVNLEATGPGFSVIGGFPAEMCGAVLLADAPEAEPDCP